MSVLIASLDEAWAEVEAALPEGWALTHLFKSVGEWQAHVEPSPAYERVRAHTWSRENGGWGTRWLGRGAHGDSPATALRALAALLRRRPL